jgi:murein DD-endopeptidase MepM/ murein hydrolase activator NlpD
MREFAAYGVGRSVVRIALTGLVGAWLAGCSADSDRFSQSYAPSSDPFNNPFASNTSGAAPSSNVAAAPLAPPGPVASADIPPAQYQPSAPLAPRTASAQPVGGTAAGWSIVGGSPIVVAQGDDADSLSRRYGVPTAALLKSNGMSSAAQIHGGVHIIVPVYSADNSPAGAKPKHLAAADDAEPTPVKHAKKLAKDEKTADAEPVKHAKAKPAKEEETADATVKPKAKAADKTIEKTADKGAIKPADKSAKTQVAVLNNADTGTTTAKKSAPDVTPTSSVKSGDAAAPMTSAEADAAGVSPEFRWPARGRIIEAFKAGGNDGINIAVPEGTSVRAAESGVVAYAGDELKGYGNLVLIRHPNGFVTAYGNNGELDVKRGDTVKRGQIIAKSGQTGNVNSPQLHFELRKGSTPVDPTSYLAGL